MAVKIGDTFRANYADGNPLWKVVRRSGKSAVIAVSQPEQIALSDGRIIEGDYAGIEQAFTVKQVESAKRWARTMSRLGDQHESFFASLKPGQIVHYHDGFGQFVRCEIVVGTAENISQGNEDLIGQLVMQPVALVGNWWAQELPRRRPNGEVVYGYHAKKVIERNGAWQANTSCIFEAPGYSRRPNEADPTTLPAIDLTVPEMTEDEAKTASAERMRAEMIDILSNTESAYEAIVQAASLALGIKADFPEAV